MEAAPVILFWLLMGWGVLSRRPVLIYLLFGTMPFAAFAVVPTGLTAGLTFTPTPIVALVLICRTLGNARGLTFFLSTALRFERLGLLFLFWLVAVFTTVFMPRLFEGSVDIIPMRAGLTLGAEPLQPTVQNVSQLAYLTISVFAVFALARYLAAPAARQHVMPALALGALVTVTTGALDMLNQYVGLDWLLDPFRTATYALLTDNQVLGSKRIVGLTPEASSYGGLCLSFLAALYFFRHALPAGRLREHWLLGLLLLLLVFLWLSTSSGAYVGLAVFAILAALEWLWRATTLPARSPRRRGLVAEFWAACGCLGALVVILLFVPAVLDPLVDVVDLMVFQKTSSDSYEERSMWTAVSWSAALSTYGLGVGLGATRASNWLVAIASNVGFPGSAMFIAFVV